MKRKKITKSYSKKEINTLNLDDSFRLCKIKPIEIKTDKWRGYRNRGKYNLLRHQEGLDTGNKIILEIPFRDFERKFYRFKDWLNNRVITNLKLTDGEYIIHGRSISKRKISNLYQIPLIHFRVMNNHFDDGFIVKRTHRKSRLHGVRSIQRSREYKIFVIFNDLRDYR